MSSPQEEGRPHESGDAQQSPVAHDAQPFDGDIAAGGNLDKIRNILFGAQARDYEKRFARLEERVARESAELRDETRRRFDALESLLKRELESLDDRLRVEESERGAAVRDVATHLKDSTRTLQDKLRAEQSERADAIKEVSGELQSAASGLDRRLAQLGEQTTKAQRELRDMLLEQSRMLSDEMRAKNEELWAALSRSVQELRGEKTDRSQLAAMLSELAMRLNDEFKFPADE